MTESAWLPILEDQGNHWLENVSISENKFKNLRLGDLNSLNLATVTMYASEGLLPMQKKR